MDQLKVEIWKNVQVLMSERSDPISDPDQRALDADPDKWYVTDPTYIY